MVARLAVSEYDEPYALFPLFPLNHYFKYFISTSDCLKMTLSLAEVDSQISLSLLAYVRARVCMCSAQQVPILWMIALI